MSAEKEDLLVNILYQEKQLCFVAIENLFVGRSSWRNVQPNVTENLAKFIYSRHFEPFLLQGHSYKT